MKKIDVKIEVEIPKTPNFIKAKGVILPLPIEDFDDESLRKIGEEWTNNMIEKAKKKRKIS